MNEAAIRKAVDDIQSEVDAARARRPRRRSIKMQRLAAFREGYFAGLVFSLSQIAPATTKGGEA